MDPGQPGTWSGEFALHSYEVDFKQQATAEVLCRLLQEAAWNHAERLGVGFAALRDVGRFWVLSRLLVQIRRFPQWNETVTVQTWPRPPAPLFALRDFRLWDTQRSCIASASSAWLIVDATSKRPLRAGKLLTSFERFVDEVATDRQPEKLEFDGSNATEQLVTATYTDMDVNRHVNGARYVGWLLNTYPVEFHAQNHLVELEINYLGESFAGDAMRLLSNRTPTGAVQHSVLKADSGQEVCRAHFRWEPAPTSGGA